MANQRPLSQQAEAGYPACVFGFLNIDKPAGPTSHDIVAAARRRIGRGVKVGHAGTLDPFAEGVLVLCVGPATRLASYVQAQPKRYRAVVRLGATSSTDDVQGEVSEVSGSPKVREAEIRAALSRFVGEIEQVPPAHSAVHVGGKRAYRLARAGKKPALAARRVRVHEMELLSFQWPLVELDIRCGSGTYVRAIARDLGEALETGGFCERLVRTEVGPFALEDAMSVDSDELPQSVDSPMTALGSLPVVRLDPGREQRIRQGKALPVDADWGDLRPGEEAALVDSGGRLVAIAVLESPEALQPRKVFPPAD